MYLGSQERLTGVNQQPCVKVHGPRHVSTRQQSDGDVDRLLHPGPEERWGHGASAHFWLPVSAVRESSGTPSSGAGGEGRASRT